MEKVEIIRGIVLKLSNDLHCYMDQEGMQLGLQKLCALLPSDQADFTQNLCWQTHKVDYSSNSHFSKSDPVLRIFVGWQRKYLQLMENTEIDAEQEFKK